MFKVAEAAATRDAYGEALRKLGRELSTIVVLDADLCRSTRTEWFAEAFPDRFFNMGIAEANMIGVAAGLARTGKIPFATTYAIFIGKAYDQIRQAVAFPHLNVKIVATHGGLAASHDGGQHQGIEDIALMRVLPGMTVLAPLDYPQTLAAVYAAALHVGPVYLRLAKESSGVVTAPGKDFTIGSITPLREGEDLAILVTGVLAEEALKAAEELGTEGISARVLGLATIKPLDAEVLAEAVRGARAILTVEEHSIIGGFGSAVAEALSSVGTSVPLFRVGMRDEFGQSGNWEELLEYYGLTASGIARVAREALQGTPPQIAAPDVNPRFYSQTANVRYADISFVVKADPDTREALRSQTTPFFEWSTEKIDPDPLLTVHMVREDLPGYLESLVAQPQTKIVVDCSLYEHLCSDGARWDAENGYLIRIDKTGTYCWFSRQNREVYLYQSKLESHMLDAVRLLKNLMTAAIEQAGAIQLHASGVVVDGRAVLLLGDQKQGKTTLLLELLSKFNACQLSCDTTVLRVNANGVSAYGSPSPFSVSQGTMSDHKQLFHAFPEARKGITYDTLWREGTKCILESKEVVKSFGSSITPFAESVGAVIFLNFGANGPVLLEHLEDFSTLERRLRAVYLGSYDPIYPNWTQYFTSDETTIQSNIHKCARALMAGVPLYQLFWAPSAESLLKRIPVLASAHRDLKNLLHF